MDLITDDAIYEIFSFLTVHDLLMMACINKRFLKISRNHVWPQECSVNSWKGYTVQILNYYTFASYSIIGDLSAIKNNHKTKNSILRYHYVKIINGFDKFKFFDRIMFYEYCDFTKECLNSLIECRFITFTRCYGLNDDNLLSLKDCHKLKFYHCHKITDQGISHLNCKKLTFHRCRMINGTGLSRSINYRYLKFVESDINNKGIYGLKSKKLILSECQYITNRGIANIKCDYLDISGCDYITDEGIENLNCTELKISDCKKLSYKNIDRLKCKNINVYYTDNINDDTLKQFQKFEKINLSNCDRVTDLGLVYLKNCKVLKICNCYYISPQGILQLNCEKIVFCPCLPYSDFWIHEISKKMKYKILCDKYCFR